MNSYAIYQIAETIRVLLVMTLSILIFNFYPVTAIMIVLLAILSDGAILSIAYDNVRYAESILDIFNDVLQVQNIFSKIIVRLCGTFSIYYLLCHGRFSSSIDKV